jgi:hypothetical protein
MLKKLAFAATLGLLTLTIASPSQAQVQKAMTWTSLSKAVVVGGKTYIYVGADSFTNGYTGDTYITESRSLLCIRKSKELADNPIPKYAYERRTPGGASINTWSGGQVFAIPNVMGSTLTSQAYADKLCQTEGLRAYNLDGFRMAEFHDGTGVWPGWNFWAEAAPQFNGLSPHPITPPAIQNMRYWVRINDQYSNPWGL